MTCALSGGVWQSVSGSNDLEDLLDPNSWLYAINQPHSFLEISLHPT